MNDASASTSTAPTTTSPSVTRACAATTRHAGTPNASKRRSTPRSRYDASDTGSPTRQSAMTGTPSDATT